MREGLVKWFNSSKGYGFIKPIDGTEAIYVNLQDVDIQLVKGQRVSFEEELGQKGLKATKIQIIDSPTTTPQ